MRVIVKARAPSFTLNFRPELTVILRIVANALLYSGVMLDVMPVTRALPPFFYASSLIRSLVLLAGIAFSLLCVSLLD